MANLSNDYPARILGTHEAPCLSLYQPTHRQFPDRQQDPIRFRNLVKQLETSLQQKYADRDIAPLLSGMSGMSGQQGMSGMSGQQGMGGMSGNK